MGKIGFKTTAAAAMFLVTVTSATTAVAGPVGLATTAVVTAVATSIGGFFLGSQLNQKPPQKREYIVYSEPTNLMVRAPNRNVSFQPRHRIVEAPGTTWYNRMVPGRTSAGKVYAGAATQASYQQPGMVYSSAYAPPPAYYQRRASLGGQRYTYSPTTVMVR